MTLVVILTVRSDAIDDFRAFERKAAMVMRKYGGAIERTVVIAAEGGEEFLKEIHIVTFPDATAFDAYREDEEIRKMSHLREKSVVKTEIMVGVDGPDYGAAG